MNKLLIATTLATLLSACAYQQKPIVDMTNVDQAQYDQDFAYCQSYAENVDKAESAKVEAQNGAAAGAVIGAIAGGLEEGIAGAAVGAVAGGAVGGGAGAIGGATDATKVQAKVLRRCLDNRGYVVYDLDK
ncbi:glycine zipper family protein [Photobacterium sp. SDRW27]|uniref:glycine zipper family protein n=1 Tax=Photobacterium obscurum TaxID=2829490 RepID=UPI0022440286|nr:glycine zipper family protein [Photobacterium obscurum]MCW8328925.1 glycine zipper family protein [Photobacterium obscurum]